MTDPISSGTKAKPVVLLADDDDDLRGRLAKRLREAGMEVVEVSDGIQLQKYLERSALPTGRGHTRPDVVVSDVRMPGKTGIEALAATREQFKVPSVVIAGTVDPGTRVSAIRAGVEAIFEKPFDVDQLVVAIRRLLAK